MKKPGKLLECMIIASYYFVIQVTNYRVMLRNVFQKATYVPSEKVFP